MRVGNAISHFFIYIPHFHFLILHFPTVVVKDIIGDTHEPCLKRGEPPERPDTRISLEEGVLS